jgi:hypothetical protein
VSRMLGRRAEPPEPGGGDEGGVRMVEYSRFPRTSPDVGARLAFTRHGSDSGLCIGCEEPEPVGSLLRVSIRDLDGRPSHVQLARVVWCRAAGDGRHWLGLEPVTNS